MNVSYGAGMGSFGETGVGRHKQVRHSFWKGLPGSSRGRVARADGRSSPPIADLIPSLTSFEHLIQTGH